MVSRGHDNLIPEEEPEIPTTPPEVVVLPVPPKATSAQEDEIAAKTHGQRKVNLIWEITQALIALSSVGAGVFIFVHQAVTGEEPADLPTTLSSMIFLVLGFYFARTNHQAIGGVGSKPDSSPYTGR